MARYKVYRLHFTSPLHISDIRDDASVSQRTVHSDTLQAALLAALAKVGEVLPENGDIGCVVSDLFPYYQKTEESKPVYFLPMPMQTTLPCLNNPADAKKVKKVQWVDSKLFSQIINGDRFEWNDDNMRMIKAAYLTGEELPAVGNFVCSEVMQRVKIEDRTGIGDAKPYYVDRISFRDYAGLYFLVRETDNTSILEKALTILVEEGIGTDRNVGYGFFDVSKDDEPLVIDTPADAEYQMALSMFIPESSEQLNRMIEGEGVAYDFVRRGGWITSTTLRKNAIYAFLPGSVFCKTTDDDVLGAIVDLRPKNTPQPIQHPVWRNGKSIMIPIKTAI